MRRAVHLSLAETIPRKARPRPRELSASTPAISPIGTSVAFLGRRSARRISARLLFMGRSARADSARSYLTGVRARRENATRLLSRERSSLRHTRYRDLQRAATFSPDSQSRRLGAPHYHTNANGPSILRFTFAESMKAAESARRVPHAMTLNHARMPRR